MTSFWQIGFLGFAGMIKLFQKFGNLAFISMFGLWFCCGTAFAECLASHCGFTGSRREEKFEIFMTFHYLPGRSNNDDS